MNDASQFRDGIPSYGAKNLRRLKAMAKKYDSEGVFQASHPASLKLTGSWSRVIESA
jgi:hypothetical protein